MDLMSLLAVCLDGSMSKNRTVSSLEVALIPCNGGYINVMAARMCLHKDWMFDHYLASTRASI